MTCPRCRGTGRVAFRRDCGMCYRCCGSGQVANPQTRLDVKPIDTANKVRTFKPPTEEELHSMLF